MDTISNNIKNILKRIILAEQQYQRQPGSVKLIAVSKTQPIAAIREAMEAGQRTFGENYLQEAIPKVIALKNEDLEWHFIGHIQANKTKEIAENFSWVHSVDRLKIAERLNNQRPVNLSPLNICIQVNIDDEVSKGGILIQDVTDLALKINHLPKLRLRGLMAIPKFKPDFAEQRATFKLIFDCLEQLQSLGLELDTLSMGMSDDFEAAIAEGANLLRIGTAIFGQRG